MTPAELFELRVSVVSAIFNLIESANRHDVGGRRWQRDEANRMRFRKLRIAWSVGCGIACVLLIVLWVRSYWWVDNALNFLGHDLASVHGNVVLDDTICFTFVDGKIIYLGGTIGPFFAISFPLANVAYVRQGTGIAVPYWALVFPLAATFTIVPWIPWSTRFSVRTLLIATTLIAMVLGLIVWLGR